MYYRLTEISDAAIRASGLNRKLKARKRIQAKRTGFRCEICGGDGKAHPVEFREIWDYNEDF